MLPKEKGGLGIINLRLQNDALLMKHLRKFYNRADIPWVRISGKNIITVVYLTMLERWDPFGGETS